MIVIDLCCPKDHRFEGWFASGEAFESQQARGLVSCPVCQATEIRRLPSAPYVRTRVSEPVATAPATSAGSSPAPNADQLALLRASIRQMARTAEDVGDGFAEEARGIHRGEREARSIRGAATGEQMGELIEEGIMVLPVPQDEDLH